MKRTDVHALDRPTRMQSLQSWGQQFRQLQGRHPALWPTVPRLVSLGVLISAVVFAGGWLVWMGQWEELDDQQIREEKLRLNFRDKVQQAQNLDALRQEKATVLSQVEKLEQQLPGKAEMDALLSEINQAGIGRGLQFELFKPGQLQLSSYYAELPIDIKLNGSYHALAGFVSDIANLPRIVTIDHLSVIQQKEGVQAFEAVVHTYRYLDKEEVESQKKRAAANQKTRGR